jgi:hypothetical protein
MHVLLSPLNPYKRPKFQTNGVGQTCCKANFAKKAFAGVRRGSATQQLNRHLPHGLFSRHFLVHFSGISTEFGNKRARFSRTRKRGAKISQVYLAKLARAKSPQRSKKIAIEQPRFEFKGHRLARSGRICSKRTCFIRPFRLCHVQLIQAASQFESAAASG